MLSGAPARGASRRRARIGHAQAGSAGARRPLRIGMVHYSEFRFDSRIQRQARALAERGDDVRLVCIGPPAQLRVGSGTITVHPVPCAKAGGGAAGYLRGYARFLAGATRRITALDLRRRFDVVEAHNMPDLLTAAAIVPRLRGTPVILNVHDTFPELFATKFGRPLDHPLVRLLEGEERLGAAMADRVITVTDEARRRLASRGVGVGRCVVVMNSPDEHVFGARCPPVDLPGEGTVRVLYHGGLADRFGVDTLVRSVARLRRTVPRVVVRICGAGDEEDRRRLARLAGEIDPERVDIASGTVPFDQIPGELRRAHVGVVPTLRNEFTELLLPVKLLEYVHMGLPVAASRLPGITGYFSTEQLSLFEPGDANGLAGAVEGLCADPARARSQARAASDGLRELAWETQRTRYLGLVDELAAAAPAASTRFARASSAAG